MPVTPYANKPPRLLSQLFFDKSGNPELGSYCAGFEVQVWRCEALADHLIEWIADYALKEDELRVHHGNMYVRLKEAAARVYTSENYKKRGEIGEVILHAICRDYFDTIPFAPRVFYLTASNDVVKSFDMVHVRYLAAKAFELWLGEAKFYEDRDEAIQAAIASVEAHIDQGFLKNEKLLLGPQISKSVPLYQEIRNLLSVQTSLDKLFQSAVFPVCIACTSGVTASGTTISPTYVEDIKAELGALAKKIAASGLIQKIRIMLIYVPLGSKAKLAEAFDARLKVFSP
jgi:HamA